MAASKTTRNRFEEIAAGPDERIDLGEAALLIAAEEYPGLDVRGYVSRFDVLALRLEPRLRRARSARDQAEALTTFLGEEQGFSGNGEDYYDPRNSYLNEVLDRRLGIPISLSVVYLEVARRAGIALVGVGFPGHFVVRHTGAPDLFLDPFHGGQVTSAAGLVELIERMAGKKVPIQPSSLDPVPTRAILIRMLQNLKVIHQGRRDLVRALAAVDRILALAPNLLEELVVRATIYSAMGAVPFAVADLERYLDLAPAGPNRKVVAAKLAELRAKEVGPRG